jgi:hypothetical protein
MAPVGGGGVGRDKKSATTFFKPGRYNTCTLNSEMKAKWHCCYSKMGQKHETMQSRAGFVVCPQLKSMTFREMAKMPDCCVCSQQFTINHGVTRLRVRQFSGEKINYSPMVPRFLLHDSTDISIGGVSGKRKFSLWGRMLAGYRCGYEVFCILESLLCRSGSLQHFGPPPPSGDRLKGATPVHNLA